MNRMKRLPRSLCRGTGFLLPLKRELVTCFHSSARCFPTFLLSKAQSNLNQCSCCEAVLTTFPCHAVSISCSRLRAAIGHPCFRMALRLNLIFNLKGQLLTLEEHAGTLVETGFGACVALFVLVSWGVACFVLLGRVLGEVRFFGA